MADDDNKPGLGTRFKEVVGRTAAKVVKAVREAAQLDFFARFKMTDDSREIDFPVDMAGDTVWATQAQMAELFGVSVSAISKHVSNIFAEGELREEATVSKLETVGQEASRTVVRAIEHYNLDMILAVGYRVSSKRATEFRKWATSVLRGYIQNGYALNGARLDSDPAALQRLAQEVRSIRTSESNIYSQVRETFKICSIDYDSASAEARSFYANTQDRFHYAISEQTAAQIILKRADATKPNMGLTTLGNVAPTAAHVVVAKNYMTAEELRGLEILGEQWLLYAEGMAHRGKAVSMQRLLKKVDEIVAVNEYAVFPGYQAIKAKREIADKHAKEQLAIWRAANAKQIK